MTLKIRARRKNLFFFAFVAVSNIFDSYNYSPRIGIANNAHLINVYIFLVNNCMQLDKVIYCMRSVY